MEMEQQLQKLTQAILVRGKLLKQLQIQCAAIQASVEEMKPIRPEVKTGTKPAASVVTDPLLRAEAPHSSTADQRLRPSGRRDEVTPLVDVKADLQRLVSPIRDSPQSITTPAQASSPRSFAIAELDNLMPARCSMIGFGDDTASQTSAFMSDVAPGSPSTTTLLDVAITSPELTITTIRVRDDTSDLTAHQLLDEMPPLAKVDSTAWLQLSARPTFLFASTGMYLARVAPPYIGVRDMCYLVTNTSHGVMVGVFPGDAVAGSGHVTLLSTDQGDKLACTHVLYPPDDHKVLWPPPMKWVERRSWLPPAHMEITGDSVELHPQSWQSFDCYRGEVQRVPPWPPPQGHGTLLKLFHKQAGIKSWMTAFTNGEMGVLNSLVHGVILVEQLLLLCWDYGKFQSLFWVQLKSYSNTHYHRCVVLETGNGLYMNGRMVMQLIGVDLRHLVTGRMLTPGERFWPAINSTKVMCSILPFDHVRMVSEEQQKGGEKDLMDNFIEDELVVPPVECITSLDWAIGRLGTNRCKEATRSDRLARPDTGKASTRKCFDSPRGADYLCKCRPGFGGNPYLDNECQDIDTGKLSSENQNYPCTFSRYCNNTPRGFQCSYPSDMSGDGYRSGTGCIPLVLVSPPPGAGSPLQLQLQGADRRLHPGTNPCVYSALGVNKKGATTCTCPTGMIGDGMTNGSGCHKNNFPIDISLGVGLVLVVTLTMTCSLVIGTLVTWCSSLVVASLWQWNGEKHTSYRLLAKCIFGPWGYWYVSFFQQVASVGNNIAIQLAAGSCLKVVYKHYHTAEDGAMTLQHFILLFGAFELFLSQLPDIHSLRWVNATCTASTIGFAGTAIGVTIYDIYRIDRKEVDYSLQGSTATKIFRAFNALGTIAFSFGDAMLLEFQSTVREPVRTNMYKGVSTAYTVIVVSYWTLAFNPSGASWFFKCHGIPVVSSSFARFALQRLGGKSNLKEERMS